MKHKKINPTPASIAFLHDLGPDQVGEFGAKTSGLAGAIVAGATVLPGIAISVGLAKQISEIDCSEGRSNLIAQWIEGLKDAHPARTYIVRSSSTFEDDHGCDFSGVFGTYQGGNSIEDIVLAIGKIVKGARAPELAPYYEENGVSIECDHMAILIQPEATPEYGGVIELKNNGASIEFTGRSISAAIAGEAPYSSLGIQNGQVEMVCLQEWDKDLTISELVDSKFLDDQFWKVASRERTIVEFFVESSILYIAQVKSGSADILSMSANAEDVVPFNAPRCAGKFAAMRFFAENNLFDKPLSTLESGWTVEGAVRIAERMFSDCSSLTIRLAKGVEIGLPRAFCSDVDEVRCFVEQHCDDSYDLIIHGYIDVERSLEILVDHDGFVVEHIPGMWESPNAHQPDVLILRNGVETQYRYNDVREPVIEGKTLSNSDLSQPLTSSDFERLSSFASRVWASFDANHRADFPLNVHVVCDSRFDKFQCLNIRPGFEQDENLLPAEDARIVKSVADLEGWNSNEIVRLSLSLSRGEEGSLIPLGRKLLDSKYPVIIDFGMLSHPAMILRRLGCRLVPSYKVAGCFSPTSYSVRRESIDIGLEPVERILREKVEMLSGLYHVVSDREPISEKHWIGVSKATSVSCADAGNIGEVTRILEQFSGGQETLFFEKGRSAFCTSIFTTPREHFHLIQGTDFNGQLDQLIQRTGGSPYASLELAYQAVPSLGAYAVFGTPRRGFWVASGRNDYEKGLLRTVFQLVGGPDNADPRTNSARLKTVAE
jgi:hypothetical protein